MTSESVSRHVSVTVPGLQLFTPYIQEQVHCILSEPLPLITLLYLYFLSSMSLQCFARCPPIPQSRNSCSPNNHGVWLPWPQPRFCFRRYASSFLSSLPYACITVRSGLSFTNAVAPYVVSGERPDVSCSRDIGTDSTDAIVVEIRLKKHTTLSHLLSWRLNTSRVYQSQ